MEVGTKGSRVLQKRYVGPAVPDIIPMGAITCPAQPDLPRALAEQVFGCLREKLCSRQAFFAGQIIAALEERLFDAQ